MTDLHFLVKQRQKKPKHPDTRGCKAADFLPTGRSSVPTRPGTSGMEHSRQTPRKRSPLLTLEAGGRGGGGGCVQVSLSVLLTCGNFLPGGPRLSNAGQPADSCAHCQGGKKTFPRTFLHRSTCVEPAGRFLFLFFFHHNHSWATCPRCNPAFAQWQLGIGSSKHPQP